MVAVVAVASAAAAAVAVDEADKKKDDYLYYSLDCPLQQKNLQDAD